jgi:hypothetical protein
MENKKINSKMILIALTMFVMFSYTKAQENIEIDYDGKNLEAINIIETIKSNIDNTNNNIKAPVAKLENETLYKSNERRIKESLNRSILSGIEYCKKKGFSILENNLKNLLLCGTIEEKYMFIYNNIISDRILITTKLLEMDNTDNQCRLEKVSKINKGVTPVCMKWDYQEVCVDKEVCHTVCDATTLICLVFLPNGVCAKWGPACSLVCNIKPECTKIPYCVEWYSDIY